MPYKDKQREQEYKRKYYKEHRERIRFDAKKRYRERFPPYKRKSQEERMKQHLSWQRNYRELIKREVFSHYSNGSMKCAHCGESDILVLCIDHINGGGNKHRQKLGLGSSIYRWLRNQGFPKGYQVLCANCNIRKYKLYQK